MKQELNTFLEYQKRELESYGDLLVTLNSHLHKHNKAKEKLIKKKTKYFHQKNLKKWDVNQTELSKIDMTNLDQCFKVMLPKETGKVTHLRKHFSFYNSMFEKELRRAMDHALAVY